MIMSIIIRSDLGGLTADFQLQCLRQSLRLMISHKK